MFQIFRTNKDTGETKPAGRVKNNDLATTSKVTKHVTGQSPSYITGNKDIKTGHTEDYTVDLIDMTLIPKDVFRNC